MSDLNDSNLRKRALTQECEKNTQDFCAITQSKSSNGIQS